MHGNGQEEGDVAGHVDGHDVVGDQHEPQAGERDDEQE